MQSVAIPYHYALQYGLGDIVREWIRVGSWPNILEDLSKEYDTNLLLCSHNENAIDFFKYIPFIKTHPVKWEGRTPDYKLIAKEIDARLITKSEREKLRARYKNKQMKIYLSGKEETIFNEISGYKYVVIHPFAGAADRMPISPKDYIFLIDNLIDKHNLEVVLLGGTFNRGRRLKKVAETRMKETFLYDRPGLINLVNKTSTRLSVKLASEANCFFGNWSVYLCAAWENKIPSIVFLKDRHCNLLTKSNGFKRRWHNKCFAINSTNRNSVDSFKEALSVYEKDVINE